MKSWLAIDIGNTAVKLGIFDGTLIVRRGRLMPDASLEDALHAWIGTTPIDRCGISSVVPEITHRLRGLQSLPAPMEVGVHLRLPFQMVYQTPETLGADRLAAAVAARELAGPKGAVVAVDAGTAITFEVIDGSNCYRGGSIAPGPDLMRRALSRGTAQLPEVDLDFEPDPIGDTTRSAIQAGILCGFEDAVTGMLGRISGALGEKPYVVVTGGWADRLARHVDAIDHVEPDLVLRGIRSLMSLNSRA